MTKINVDYQAGRSRYSEAGIDFMLAEIDGIELYAEIENPTDMSTGDEEAVNYDELKAEIIRQAQEAGIETGRLRFWYDEEPKEKVPEIEAEKSASLSSAAKEARDSSVALRQDGDMSDPSMQR